MHPYDNDAAIEELERVAAAGARGVKLHPNTQDFDVADERVAAVVDKSGELGLPVLFDAYSPFDAQQPGKFVKLAMGAKQSKIVLAHMHGPRFLELLVYEVLAGYPWWRANVWHDVSWAAAAWASSPYAEQYRRLQAAGETPTTRLSHTRPAVLGQPRPCFVPTGVGRRHAAPGLGVRVPTGVGRRHAAPGLGVRVPTGVGRRTPASPSLTFAEVCPPREQAIGGQGHGSDTMALLEGSIPS